MVFVSACAQQPAPVPAQPSQPPQAQPTPEPQVQPEPVETAPVAAPEDEEVKEVVETTSNEIKAAGAGTFDPAKLTISTGTSVTWINDAGKNMVIIIFKDSRSYIASQKFDDGEKFEHEFTEAGEYPYWQNVAFSGDGGTITVE